MIFLDEKKNEIITIKRVQIYIKNNWISEDPIVMCTKVKVTIISDLVAILSFQMR